MKRHLGRHFLWSAAAVLLLVSCGDDGDVATTAGEQGAIASQTTTTSPTTTASGQPDAQSIAFRSDRDGQEEIYVIAPNGSGLINLTDDPADDEDPAWSPDGSKMAFCI